MTRDRRRQFGDVVDIVDATAQPCAHPGQTRQPVDLARVAQLVGQKNVANAAAHENLGLADLLTTDPAGPADRDLQFCKIDGFMHLAMHPQAHSLRLGIGAHLAQVAFKRVHVQH